MRIEKIDGKTIYWMDSMDEEIELNREQFMDLHYRNKAEMRAKPLWDALGEKRYKALFTPWNVCSGAFYLGTCG